jgi:RimJ/RimL family protein N-acetyltransferase
MAPRLMPPVMEITATERLRLRPLHTDDLPAFVAYRSHPDVARYQSWDPTYAMSDADALLAAQADVAFGTPGAWVQVAAIDRTSGELVGDCAVHVLADQPATAEVGVTLAPARQGAGLATEALGAIVSTLFEVHQMHRVFGQVDDRNTAVQNLFGRLGFREARQVEADWFKGEWTTMRVYAMLEREWRAARSARLR